MFFLKKLSIKSFFRQQKLIAPTIWYSRKNEINRLIRVLLLFIAFYNPLKSAVGYHYMFFINFFDIVKTFTKPKNYFNITVSITYLFRIYLFELSVFPLNNIFKCLISRYRYIPNTQKLCRAPSLLFFLVYRLQSSF